MSICFFLVQCGRTSFENFPKIMKYQPIFIFTFFIKQSILIRDTSNKHPEMEMRCIFFLCSIISFYIFKSFLISFMNSIKSKIRKTTLLLKHCNMVQMSVGYVSKLFISPLDSISLPIFYRLSLQDRRDRSHQGEQSSSAREKLFREYIRRRGKASNPHI